MEFTLGIKPLTVKGDGEVVYGRLLLLNLIVSLKSQYSTRDGQQRETLEGKRCEQGQSRTLKNYAKPTSSNWNTGGQMKLMFILSCL